MFDPRVDQLTVADDLLFFLAYELLRDSPAQSVFRKRAFFARNAWCRLQYADDLVEGVMAVDFLPWVNGLGAAIVESLQEPLAERWYAIECGKRAIADWMEYERLGEALDHVVEPFLQVVEQSRRFDLARFLLKAAVRYCTPIRDKDDLIGGLQSSGPPRLAARYAAQKQWALLARVLHRMLEWQREARS